MARPWAKLVRNDDGTLRAALPLADHGFDVAAALEALLAGGAWDRALATAAGRALTPQDRARMVALAALHDIGKANAGFQARIDPEAPRIGHEPQVAALLNGKSLCTGAAGQPLRDIARGWGAGEHLAALMAHHGRPREEFHRSQEPNRTWEKHVNLWRAAGGYDPVAKAAALIAAVRRRWPLAWEDGAKLPGSPGFVALFAGLMTLADWIGSDQRRFPVKGPHGARRERLRQQQAAEAIAARGLLPLTTPDVRFEQAFGFAPRGVQCEAAADDLGPIALIEAETGSGKTEAALWRWLALRRAGTVDGLYFALPTRSAAVQLHARVNAMLKRVWGEGAPEAVLAVPGYIQAGDATGERLPEPGRGWDVIWDDGGSDARWAAERSNRYLAARIAVGTIDQALLAALQVKHAHVRAATLARSLLVVDEVHASDAYMGGLLKRLLANHAGVGGRALLLSATLGAEARVRLLDGEVPLLEEAEVQPYPALAGSAVPPRQATADGTTPKQVHVEVAGIIADPGAIAARAIEAARRGASVLIVRNSVAGAIVVAQAVEADAPDLAFRVEGVPTLHHGRFAPSDRKRLDAAVEAAFGKDRSARGRILVGTQTLEQSLDIDADLLVTDLAPMDVLLQRIGRLHRHPRTDRGAFAKARAVVLRPAERDLTPLLRPGPDRHGLGPRRDGTGVYPNLLYLEATLRLLEGNPTIVIPADNRRLVEHALHPDVSEALAAEMGTAWTNHGHTMNGIGFMDRDTARSQSLDLGARFTSLIFPNAAEQHIATRLGAQDWLIHFDPFAGPFGRPVERLSIPHWMAGPLTPEDRPELLGRDDSGQRFRLGQREYVYGRWGLSPASPS